MPARIVPKDAAGAETSEDWLRRMDEIGEDEGYFERLGGVHWSFFADHGTTLLVTFERLHDIRTGSPGQMPFGYGVAVPQGWSHLCLVAGQDRWYRDPTVFRYFDRLVDDAFFEDFDRVVFYGAGMGGYAAAAFSVVAPGATVILAAPQATLDPLYAVWDPRFRSARRLNFTDRYGYAPDMTEGAGQVFVIHDPENAPDAAHAALFRRPFATLLRTPGLGTDPHRMLAEMGALDEVLLAAGQGGLSPAVFYRALRARHRHLPYLRMLLGRTDARGRDGLSARVCRAVLRDHAAPRFRKRLAEIEGEAG